MVRPPSVGTARTLKPLSSCSNGQPRIVPVPSSMLEEAMVDDLLARGYDDITVLDISPTAWDAIRKRLGRCV